VAEDADGVRRRGGRRLKAIALYGSAPDVADRAPEPFSIRQDAEEFVAEDPFVVHGVVATVDIHDWNEILT